MRAARESGGFAFLRDLTMSQALGRLQAELRRLGVRGADVVVSTNVPIRLDGLPYSGYKQPDDPGAAVYFKLKRADRVLACDTWLRVEDNVAAIAKHIEAIRAIDRFGVGSLEQAFAGYQALPSKGQTWRTTLGLAPDAVVDRETIDQAFKRRAREVHPDVPGGSHDAMASLTAARDEALATLEVMSY